MITKPKQKTLPGLIKELDTVFSQYIRLRDSDAGGTVTCFITGERIFWKDADAAHWIKRGNMSMRYNERNVHATTIESNRFDPDHDELYTRRMVDRYGIIGCGNLKMLSIGLQKFTRPELEEMISDYKEKVKQLRKDKGL